MENSYSIATEAIERILISSVKSLADLKGYDFDNRYVCDRTGNVYLVVNQDRFKYFARPMRPFTTRDGYTEYVLTTKYGTKKHIQAQRIVAGLYLPEVPGKEYVNHKNLNRQDNNVNNLEWVTHSENVKHSWDNRKR